MSKLNIGDRVTRKDRPNGIRGTIKDIRTESFVTSSYAANRELQLIISVLWDNGTRSVFGPEGLNKFEG